MTTPQDGPLSVADALDRVLAAQDTTRAAQDAEKAARRQLEDAMHAARTRKHDDADTGVQVRLEQRGPSLTVVNTTAYTAWVRAHHPHALRETVDPVWQASHLKKGVDVVVMAADEDGTAVFDQGTGDEVPGVRVGPVPAERLVVTPPRVSGQDQ